MDNRNTLDLDAMAARVKQAADELSRICRETWSGGKPWHWEIPANPERDSDLLLGGAIEVANALIKELRARPAPEAPPAQAPAPGRECWAFFLTREGAQKRPVYWDTEKSKPPSLAGGEWVRMVEAPAPDPRNTGGPEAPETDTMDPKTFRNSVAWLCLKHNAIVRLGLPCAHCDPDGFKKAHHQRTGDQTP